MVHICFMVCVTRANDLYDAINLLYDLIGYTYRSVVTQYVDSLMHSYLMIFVSLLNSFRPCLQFLFCVLNTEYFKFMINIESPFHVSSECFCCLHFDYCLIHFCALIVFFHFEVIQYSQNVLFGLWIIMYSYHLKCLNHDFSFLENHAYDEEIAMIVTNKTTIRKIFDL